MQAFARRAVSASYQIEPNTLKSPTSLYINIKEFPFFGVAVQSISCIRLGDRVVSEIYPKALVVLQYHLMAVRSSVRFAGSKKLRAACIASILSILLNVGSLQAQVYPSRPITIVVPLPAGGGGADTLTRILAEQMERFLGQPVIVENIPGAGGSIGVGRVVRAEPDGYTLITGNWATHIGASAVYPVQYDVLRDLEPISHMTDAPYWIVARRDFPASNLKELLEWLKANSGKATAGTLGVGSGSHICAKYFQNKTEAGLQLVPYRGGPPAMQDLVAGRIDIMCDYAPNSLAYVRSGQIKALAVMANTRWAASPDTPTVDEMGVRGLYFSSWQGLWAPKGTPREIIDRLNASVMHALADPTVRKKITNLGQEIAPAEQQTPSAFAALLKDEVEKWRPIIKAH